MFLRGKDARCNQALTKAGEDSAYNRIIRLLPRMNIPIRIRLSISYSLIFLVAGTLLCGASYWLARRSLYFAFDHELDEHIDDVHDFFAAHSLAADQARAISEVNAEFVLKDDGKWLQIADDQGHWIYRARRMLLTPHDIPPSSALPAKGSVLEFSAGDKQVRSLRRAFKLDGHTFLVETGATLTKTNQTLALFRNSLLLISPIIFIAAGFAGHSLSLRALDPVAAIAHEAQRIHDGNLQLRLPQLKSGDELAHLSATLNDMLERIESSVRSVRDFTAYASHELRTPVALIRTEADLALQFERSGKEYREAIAVIGSEAQRMSSLLDSLLFLARADSGAEQVRLEPVDVRLVCRQVCEKWKPLLKRSQLQFIAGLTDAPRMVLADGLYLQRLITVLLENAWKYTPPGGSVWLSLDPLEDSVRISIGDTGIGIPLQDQPHIFDRFRRGSNVQQSEAHGSGLGLALAAWIAKCHRTEIQLDSAPGTGSTFAFTLPVAQNTRSHFATLSEPEATLRA
ncbi:MAG: HAMP domain-containing sensor histidine kinase [Terracidiphilus sp.]